MDVFCSSPALPPVQLPVLMALEALDEGFVEEVMNTGPPAGSRKRNDRSTGWKQTIIIRLH